MDIDKYLKTVTNLNKYITFTWDFQNKRIDLKIPFNISTIISLKNIRSIEIEYFNKYEENGGATKIVELLLRSPPSKTWGLLGGELINLLQYWLEAIRKHLIIHNIRWWTFLNLILKFIKVISLKDNTLNKVLIEETAECLLDLATHTIPDADQRSEIIQIFNGISAESSRSIRFAYKEKFKDYFTKLSSLLASAGDLPLQHRALEGLLRWLLPRHQPAVRRAAAAEWFPKGMFSRRAVDIFLERPWHDFIKDARDFLNAQNESTDLITSVICKTFSVGNRICLSNKSDCWLDLNASTKRLSILLDPRWDALGSSVTHDAVLISDDNTMDIELKLESQQVLIIATVLELSRVYPFSNDVIGDTNSCTNLRITVSNRSDISRLDRSLRAIFGDKYKMSLDMSKVGMCMSPNDKISNSDVINGTEEDIRFSMPPELPRRKHSGYIVRHRNLISRNSSSTFSTSSLAQLHEKLAALPRYTFDKEAVSVCVLPQLSTVSEVSEPEECCTRNSSLSTIKYRRYGVTYQRINKDDSKTSPNTSIDRSEKSNLSPSVIDGDNSQSCLLLATIGSGDESIINDTIERLPKNVPCNTHNIITLLAQEALETTTDRADSGINTGDNKKIPDVPYKSTVCVNQPFSQFLQDNPLPNEHRVIEESSNDIVENTPFSWDQVKRSKYKSDKNTTEPNTALSEEPDGVKLVHNVDAVEHFFSQHVIANRNGDIVISPTLARKINETSSECSEDIGQCVFKKHQSLNYIVQEVMAEQCFEAGTDIVDCVNSLVNQVCQDLDECATHIDVVDKLREVDSNMYAKHTSATVTQNNNNEVVHNSNAKDNSTKHKGKTCSTIKLKFPKRKSISPKNAPNTTKKSKNESSFTIMSPIIEIQSLNDNDKDDDNLMQSPSATSLLRRKRKLYSPKDETCHEKINIQVIDLVEKDGTTNVSKLHPKSPKSLATCYKELEQEHKERDRKLRAKLSLTKPVFDSPRTLKMNQIFDSLIGVNHGEPVKLADKSQPKNNVAVYNNTSESDDEYLVQNKTTSVSKEVSSPAANSAKTSISCRTDKHKNKTVITKEITDNKISKSAKRERKRSTNKTISKLKKDTVAKIPQSPVLSLTDERMRRVSPEYLNTSVTIECPKNSQISPDKQSDPILIIVPQLESIDENNLKPDDKNIKDNKLKTKTKRSLSLRRNKDISKANQDSTKADNDGSLSPLPGLLVETILTTQRDVNDSVSDNMIQKFKDIYEGKRVIDSKGNTTNERINCSSSKWNGTEEPRRVDRNKRGKSCTKETTKNKIKKFSTGKRKVERESIIVEPDANQEPDIIQMSISDNSEKSIATMGSSHSPITAHGDFDEEPPSTTLLNQYIQPRIVEQEYLNQSSKDFYNKLTAQLHETSKHDYNYNYRVKTPVVVMERLSPEYIRSRLSVNSSVRTRNSKTNFNLDSSPKTRRDYTENNKDDANNVKGSSKTSTQVAKRIVKSSISPIKLCSRELRNSKMCNVPPPSEDNCLEYVRNIFTNRKLRSVRSISAIGRSDIPTSLRRSPRIYTATSSPISRKHSLERKQSKQLMSSEASVSSKASKRNSSPIVKPLKKSKYDKDNNNFGSITTESQCSSASVNEWFKKNKSTCKADNTQVHIKEALKIVLEKLDTTLIEIHHDTSKRFINMSVEATTQLDDLTTTRERLQRDMATEIIRSVVKLVDDKFLELNERLKSMEHQFMESFKNKTHIVIQSDYKQKRAMVRILKEDVQAVLNHMEKTRQSC